MPELPEVETITRKLAIVLPGKKIATIEVYKDKSFVGDQSSLIGKEITAVNRRAKILQFDFEDESHLITHLKMTGQLLFVDGDIRVGGGHPTADWVSELPSKHTRILYEFSDGSKLFFNDMRIFGWMKMVTAKELQEQYKNLGPDINDPTLTVDYLFELFQRRSIPVKQALMDNSIVCGVGNIYACDALNLARINPYRPANSLSLEEVSTLLQAAQTVIAKAIELGGTTSDGMYVHIDGLSGQYQDHVLTYGRKGEPCYNCGTPLIKERIAGRGTYYCPSCQW